MLNTCINKKRGKDHRLWAVNNFQKKLQTCDIQKSPPPTDHAYTHARGPDERQPTGLVWVACKMGPSGLLTAAFTVFADRPF
jgi:hypothetical protein